MASGDTKGGQRSDSAASIRLLGPVAFERAGSAQRLGGRRQAAVLAYLTLHRRREIPADVLIEALWTDPPKTARNSIQRFVSDLRRADNLLASRLRSEPGGYVLDVADDEVDVGRVEALLAAAAASQDVADVADAAEQATLLSDALSEWVGEPLGAIGDPPFADLERARLEEVRLGALEARIDADLSTGRHRELLPELERLVEDHPFRERVWGQLMLALYRSGRQADALAAFRRVEGLLLDELGVDASPELQALEVEILRQDQALARDGGGPPARLSAPEPSAAARGYELGELIGSSEYGEVRLGRQLTTGRDVAVKVVGSERADDPPFIRDFETANQGVAALEHPHIVPLYDWWREPAAAYLVMRLLRGGTLDHADAIDEASRREALAQVADALRTAHDRGIRHGGIGAGNVLLDEDGNAYLTDFGIARPATVDQDVADFVAMVESVLPGTLGSRSFDNVDDVMRALHSPTVGRSETSNPYKGLRAFQESDAAHFFGRDRLTTSLVERLESGRFLAVIGPSGSGKSSAVRAGLVPAIRTGAIEGSSRWFVVDMIPGAAPLDELARALRRVAVDPPSDLRSMLTSGPDGIRRVVDLVLPTDDSEMVLIVDQFEELFTLVPSDRARQRFIDALVVAVTNPRSRLRVVATMRADFYDRPLEIARLGELFRASSETVIPLTAEELERAIVGPGERVGVTFEPALIGQMVSEVVDQPAALPLLQYALTELFDGRESDRIDGDDYARVGGVNGALARRADWLFDQLPGGDQLVFRQLLLRLVTVGDDARQDTRRRVPRPELDAVADREAVGRVLDEFGRHRLLTHDRDAHTGTPTVEVAHEALLREWRRLREWIDLSRDDIRQHRWITAAARDWDQADREASFLLSGSRLDGVMVWRESSDLSLTDMEAAFIAASVDACRRAETAERERLEREADLERRANRRLRTLVAVLGISAVVAIGLSLFALDRRDEAESQARRASVQGLASRALAELDVDPELALLLALESVDRGQRAGEAPIPDVIDALHRGLDVARLSRRLGSGVVAEYSPDGTLIARGDAEGTVMLDHADGLGETVRIDGAHDGRVTTIAFAGDGSVIATGGEDGRARLWDAGSGVLLSTAAVVDGQVDDVEFDPAGDRVLVGARDGRVRLADARTGSELNSRVISVEDNPAPAVWRADGLVMALSSTERSRPVTLDGETLQPTAELGAMAPPCALALSPSNDMFLAGVIPGDPFLERLDGDGDRITLSGHGSLVCALDFSADGTRFATGSLDGTIRVWSSVDATSEMVLAGHSAAVNAVAFHPDGERLLSASAAGEVLEWDVRLDRTPERARWFEDRPGIDVRFVGGSSERMVVIHPFAIDLLDAETGDPIVDQIEVSRVGDEFGHPSAVTPDGAFVILAGTRAGLIDVRASDTLEVVRRLEGGDGGVARVRMNPSGSRLAATTFDGSVHMWSFADGRLLWSHDVEQQGPTPDVDFTGDGSLLAVGGTRAVVLFDVETGKDLASLPAREQTVITMASGTRLFTSGLEGQIIEWDAQNGEIVRTIRPGSSAAVMAHHPEIGVLVVGELDGTVSVWDDDTGSLVVDLPPHPDAVRGVDIDQTGSWVASSDESGLVLVRALATEELVDMAKSRVTRTLTEDECMSYAGSACE